MFKWLREQLTNAWLKDIHIHEGHFGKESVILTDRITMSNVSPVASGEIGMDMSSGRPEVFVDGAARKLAHTDELSGTGGSGQLQLIETQEITVDTQSVTFSGLNGDADELYQVMGTIKKVGSISTNYSFVPNGAGSGINCQSIQVASGVLSSFDITRLAIGINVPASGVVFFDTFISAEKSNGKPRLFNTHSAIRNGNQTATIMEIHSGVWNDISANLTSLVIVANTGMHIGSGSFISLYKIKKT